MKISFIVPVYNCKIYLPSCVESIRTAGFEDYEILLIDDGSTDGTGAVCDALAEKYSEIRPVHQANTGVSGARNQGIREATGQYILFLDADDAVDAAALASCRNLLLNQMPDMLVFGMSFDYYFHSRLYRREEMICPLEGMYTREQWMGSMETLYWCNALSPVWNKFIRRELLVENQILFPEGMIEMEDFWFSVRCMNYCRRVYFLPKVVYRYRQAEDEANTYRRLCRIPSLSEYMEPFADILADIPGGEEITAAIYKTFFYEMIRFGSISEIQRLDQDMRRGKYAQRIAADDPKLYRLLEKQQYQCIRLRSILGKLRHAAAVRIKFLISGDNVK